MIEALVERLARRISAATSAPPVPTAIQNEMDGVWRARLGALDFPAVRAQFFADGEFLVLPALIPTEITDRAIGEIDDANPFRSGVPWIRSAQHVGWRTLQRIAPVSTALYRSRVFLDWMTELVGRDMLLKDDDDDHSCATYEYERTGDHMRFHYDTCGCDEGTSYSQLLSLYDRSSQRLLVDLHTKDDQPVEHRTIHTVPGTLTVFCGSKVWHGVSPLGVGERRVILSMSYATDPTMPPWRRLFENAKDAALYFGPASLLQRNFRRRMSRGTR